MGIVANQSIKNLIITYVGFGIGAVNLLFLYTHFLEDSYNGLVSFLLSSANLIWPLMAFGLHNTLVKFYSSYSTREEQDKFLNLVIFFPIIVAVITGCVGLFFYDFFLEYFNNGIPSDQDLLKKHGWLIFVIALSMAYFELFFSWVKVQLKSVFGNFMKEIFHRICVSLLLIAVYLKWLTVDQFIYGLTFVFIARLIILKIYAFRLRSLKIRRSLPYNYKMVLKYSSLILIAGSVAAMMIDLDKAMIKKYLPFGEVMVYGLSAYIASVIAVPARAMHQITYPLTAKLMNEKNTIELFKLYKNSSINLLIVSGLMFVLIVCNVHELYKMIPERYNLLIVVVLLIAIVKLYENLLGNNNSILYNSDYYRIVLAIGAVLAVMAYVLNIIFIPKYGLNGAAIATFTAMFCYNTIKLIYIKVKFNMQPFSYKTVGALMIIIGFTLGFYYWNFTFHPLVNIILKSVLIAGGYIITIYILKLSPEINTIIKKIPRGA